MTARDRRQSPILQPYPPRHQAPLAGRETRHIPPSRKLHGSEAAISDPPRTLYLTRTTTYAKTPNANFADQLQNGLNRKRRWINLNSRTHGRGNRDASKIGALGTLRLGLGHCIHECNDVFDKFFLCEGDFAHAALDDP